MRESSSAKLLQATRIGLSIASFGWVVYSLLGFLAPGALCAARLGDYCAEASKRALESEPVDSAAALRFSQRGCALGHAVSCNNLGVCYERGVGTTRDLVRAERQYRQVCDMGQGLGCYNYAALVDADDARAEQATAAFARACALKYALGCRASIRHSSDTEHALSFAEQGCAQADDPSCAAKAVMLAATRANSSEGRESIVKLTTRCSENEPVSCASLGLLYAAGAGVTRDLSRAHELLARACRNGSERACAIDKQPGLLERMPQLLPHISRVMFGASKVSL